MVDARLSALDPRWQQGYYLLKEKRLTLGRKYRILDASGNLVAFCKQKMFKLREDIRFYANEDQKEELFRLQTPKALDFNAAFGVIDSTNNAVLGYLGRKGWRSMLRDTWFVYDAAGQPLATLQEDSAGRALIRRFVALGALLPYRYDILAASDGGTRKIAEIKERFNLFGDSYDVRLHTPPGQGPMDARVLLGLAVCMDAIEGE